MRALPSFIAFTGVDCVDLLPGMQHLSRHFAIEWGVLVDDARDELLFADPDVRAKLLEAPGLRYAAHVCGEQAGLIANDPARARIDLARFQRLQVNHGFSGSSPEQIENSIRFGRAQTIRTMLQTLDAFPGDARLDWLYDTSFGTGKTPESWPRIPAKGPFCGFSGGIRAENVAAVLDAIAAPEDGQFWIDMESGVRTDGRFDLAKCEAVCRAVFG
ncbi:phosphoribosylanthranilate isomerase [Sphingopyxis lindanitolerans]|uniref:Phosphoribosylanthranilate isomerase n=1 Tax=Sphingopyxis lindanitolerans TaxID=2054227 RepID=A0A2S8B271_9SPHN|nr:phosphoribosylanthranilate isomerase [Sphingopyxis lindanitolerans]PQM26511.1 phosphoribosylanthranilate isomerase [Sphingopyxis lindanitolerans]